MPKYCMVPKEYKTIQKEAQILPTLFSSMYLYIFALCVTFFSKMKYPKNIYKNQITDYSLNNLRVICSS